MEKPIRNYYIFNAHKIILVKDEYKISKKLYIVIFCMETKEYIIEEDIEVIFNNFYKFTYNYKNINSFHFKPLSEVLKIPSESILQCFKPLTPNKLKIKLFSYIY